jgi:sporulation protein YqfD
MSGKNTRLHADTLKVEAKGKAVEQLLNAAVKSGIRVSSVEKSDEACTFAIAGRDWKRLNGIAQRGGWQTAIQKRSGPGRWEDWLLSRPGVLLGILLFLVLLRCFSGFVWKIDFTTMNADAQKEVRDFLWQQGICEGSRITEEALASARGSMMLDLKDTGWLTLNFGKGILTVENTSVERRQIKVQMEDQALYAKADALVLATNVTSGFLAVQAGQTVAEGQLLAATEKLDRSGNPV